MSVDRYFMFYTIDDMAQQHWSTQDIKLNRSIRKLKCNFYSSTNYGCGDAKKTL